MKNDISTETTLLDFIAVRYMQSLHGWRKKKPQLSTFVILRKLCGVLRKVLGREPTIGDLTEANLDAMTEALKAKLAEKTIRLYCQHVLAVWRFASDEGVTLLPFPLRRTKGNPVTRNPSNDKEPFQLVDSPLTLWGICVREFFPLRLQLRSDETKRLYKLALRNYGNFLGRQPVLGDLSDDAVTVWVKAQLDSDKSVHTCRERMGRILTLWRWCASRRMVEKFPTIRRPEAPEIVPTALDERQLKALFESASEEPGKIEGIKAGFWWQAYLGFVWSTGERRGAALELRWSHIDLERKGIVIPPDKRKGRRKTAVYSLWPEVASLLARIQEPARELVFPWPHSEGRYYHNYGRILRRAGIPDTREFKTHALRRSHATWLKILGGDPTASLMHSSPEVTARHYIDPRLMPPPERKLFAPWKPDLQSVQDDVAGLEFV